MTIKTNDKLPKPGEIWIYHRDIVDHFCVSLILEDDKRLILKCQGDEKEVGRVGHIPNISSNWYKAADPYQLTGMVCASCDKRMPKGRIDYLCQACR